MKVYHVNYYGNIYQSFYLEDRGRVEVFLDDPLLNYDCTPKAEIWKPLEMFVLHPKLKVPDFWSFECPGAMIVSEEAYEKTATFLEMAGELLPVRCGGKEFKLLNVIECINCLKRAESHLPGDPPAPRGLHKYVFHPDRFGASSLFKIPESVARIFTWEEEGDPENEFKAAVEHHGLKGLRFDLLWEG